MQMRISKPGAGNKFFITTGAGGYSRCIVGKPKDSQCNVLSNCVGYACGRFNEIIGSMKYPYLNCNAENFIERAKSAGLQVVSYPTLGGIMVWQKGATLSGNDGAGHVAVVERIDSANQIYTSESGYGSSAFWNSVRKNTNGRWGMSSGYSFRGCIINPAIGDVHYTEPVAVDTFPNISDEELAKRVWNGDFGNGDARKKALGIRYNAVQTLVNKGFGKPSTPTPQPKPEPTPSVDILTLVKKTIRGDFGNGEARKKALGSNYAEVQRQVNLNIKNGLTRWDNIKLF
jgi:surface antigen